MTTTIISRAYSQETLREAGFGADHLNQLELRLARRLGAFVRDIAMAGPPTAAIIGEAPGHNTSPKLPVFPLPSSSAGGRLISYSKISPAVYLGMFWRKNVYTYLEPWSRADARFRAEGILEIMRLRGITRAVLLGVRVGAAFGLPELWSHGERFGNRLNPGIELAVIPHPSGRCRVYNDVAAQRRAGATLRWAARLRVKLP